MHGRRNATRDIWRAVVMAGAMLGCSGSSRPAASTPAPAAEPVPAEATGAPEGEEAPANPHGGPAMESAEEMAKKAPPPVDAGVPDAAPPDARPRKRDGKPRGRGFVLA